MPSLRSPARPSPPLDRRPPWPRQGRDLVLWAALVGVGLVCTAVAVATGARVGVAAAPFTGRYRLRLGPASLLAPVLAGAVLVAVRRGIVARLRWRVLLATSFLLAVGWALALALVDGRAGLAGPLERPDGYLSDATRIGGDPLGFLRTYVSAAGTLTPDARQHPPGPVLLLWALGRLGVTDPAVLGILVTALGCLSVPLVGVAVRSLCHEPAARALLPLLALAPYAIWLAVSLDAVALSLCAGAVACGVIGSEPRRTPLWAAGAGLLLGVGALFSYNVAWLGTSILVVYFVRRRPLLNLVSGTASLLPIGAARLAGFVWPDGLAAARRDIAVGVGPQRSWALWIVLDLVLVLVATGPAVLAAARKVRRTPGWPFLVGAAAAVLVAVGSGLSRGEVERSFLPFFPWLLVAAVAPEPGRSDREVPPSPPPLLLAAAAATAVVVTAVVRTAW